MRIGWVGGLERSETKLVKTAADAGHVLEFHAGKMGGRGTVHLRNLVDRSELVVILTAVNSHQAVWQAKEAAHKYKRPAIIMQKCGQSSLKKLLNGLKRTSIIS